MDLHKVTVMQKYEIYKENKNAFLQRKQAPLYGLILPTSLLIVALYAIYTSTQHNLGLNKWGPLLIIVVGLMIGIIIYLQLYLRTKRMEIGVNSFTPPVIPLKCYISQRNPIISYKDIIFVKVIKPESFSTLKEISGLIIQVSPSKSIKLSTNRVFQKQQMNLLVKRLHQQGKLKLPNEKVERSK